jgi:hypothetical protein
MQNTFHKEKSQEPASTSPLAVPPARRAAPLPAPNLTIAAENSSPHAWKQGPKAPNFARHFPADMLSAQAIGSAYHQNLLDIFTSGIKLHQ